MVKRHFLLCILLLETKKFIEDQFIKFNDFNKPPYHIIGAHIDDLRTIIFIVCSVSTFDAFVWHFCQITEIIKALIHVNDKR